MSSGCIYDINIKYVPVDAVIWSIRDCMSAIRANIVATWVRNASFSLRIESIVACMYEHGFVASSIPWGLL